MIGTQRTGSALTGRPLKEHAIDAREGAERGETPPVADDGRGIPSPDLEHDVSSSLETIRRVTQTYAILLDKLSAYELKVRELSQALGTATMAKEAAQKASAEAERELAAERRRGAQAQEQAAASERNVRQLESQLDALRAQTAKLIQAVDQLFPDTEDMSTPPRALRVVR